jgi:hypothetical protein
MITLQIVAQVSVRDIDDKILTNQVIVQFMPTITVFSYMWLQNLYDQAMDTKVTEQIYSIELVMNPVQRPKKKKFSHKKAPRHSSSSALINKLSMTMTVTVG